MFVQLSYVCRTKWQPSEENTHQWAKAGTAQTHVRTWKKDGMHMVSLQSMTQENCLYRIYFNYTPPPEIYIQYLAVV